MNDHKEVSDVKEAILRLNRNRNKIREESKQMAFKIKCFNPPTKNTRNK